MRPIEITPPLPLVRTPFLGFRRIFLCRSRTCLLAVLLCAGAAASQTLARPGWVGSGMTIEHWWKHAVMYGVSVTGSGDQGSAEVLRGLAQQMDDLQALGVDAVLLRDLSEIRVSPTDLTAETMEEQQKLEAFDDLMQQASRHRLRVLVELRSSASADLTAKARFWLNRGVAGFSLALVPAAANDSSTDRKQAEAVAAIRAALKGYAGERIVIGVSSTAASIASVPADVSAPALAGASAPSHHRRQRSRSVPGSAVREERSGPTEPEMVLILAARPAPETAAVRSSLETAITRIHTSPTTPLLALQDAADQQKVDDQLPRRPIFARAEAALLFGFGIPALIDSRILAVSAPPAGMGVANQDTSGSQPKSHPVPGTTLANAGMTDSAAEDAGRRSLYEWYRRMNGLSRGNSTLRSGGDVILDHDQDQSLVWVRTPKGAGPVVFLACNLSDRPVTLSLMEDVQRLRLRGSFLRTLLRSDEGMGAMPLRAVALAPYGVYVGELAR